MAEQERAEVDAAYRQRRAERQRDAAENALRMWQAATPIHGTDHPYLSRKSVLGLGAVRLLKDTLLVPLSDVKSGELCTFDSDALTGEKYNLEGGRKAGVLAVSARNRPPAGGYGCAKE